MRMSLRNRFDTLVRTGPPLTSRSLIFEMPGLYGRDFLLRMRAIGAKFPIILLTGHRGALSDEDCVLFARCIDKTSLSVFC